MVYVIRSKTKGHIETRHGLIAALAVVAHLIHDEKRDPQDLELVIHHKEATVIHSGSYLADLVADL